MLLSAPLLGEALVSYQQFQAVRLFAVFACALWQAVFWLRFRRLGVRLLPCLITGGLLALSALALLWAPHAALFFTLCCVYALLGSGAGIVCAILWKKFNLS